VEFPPPLREEFANARTLSDDLPGRSDDEHAISDHEMASNEEQPSATDDSQPPSRFASRVQSEVSPFPIRRQAAAPLILAPPPRDSESELADVSDLAPPEEPREPKPPVEPPVAAPKSVSSMLSFLVDEGERPPSAAPRGAAVVVKKSKTIELLTRGTPQTTAPPVAKKLAPCAQSRKVPAAKLPEWQIELASTFLLVPDMSCADDEDDLADPVAADGTPPETDVITEETTRCLCNSTHESEVMIQCDSCKKWLHEDCVRLQNSREADPFICIFCQYELSRSIKTYLRRKMAEFPVIMKRVQASFPFTTGSNSKPIWNEMLSIVQDAQSVLAMIPLFLPSTDEAEPQADETTTQFQ
jgi:hypothetical protein